MNELRLIFHNDPQADAPGVQVVPGEADKAGGIAAPEIPFNFALSNDDYENLRWYLEDFMDLPDGGAVVRAQSVEGKLRQWGRQLHDAVFSEAANNKLLAQLLNSPEPRVLTIGTADPSLLRLPWELIADGAGPLAHRVSVRRQLEAPEALVERPAVLPLRILYIVSRPGDTGFIDPRLTTRSVFDALDPLGGSVQIDFCRPPTVGRMEELLREAELAGDPYDLVHFDGHGTFDPGVQLGGLYFEKPDDGSGAALKDLVPADRLGEVLAAHKVPLVILEACRSATVGQTAVFRSVAPRLIQAGVASVLSMGHAVHVEAARLLLDRFYRELVRGTTIGHAVAQARTAMLGTPARWVEYGPQGRTIALQDWFLPHLYQRGLDEPLLPPPLPETSGTQPRQFDVFLSHNRADRARVTWLATELTNKHGFIVWLDEWQKRIGPLEDLCAEGIRDSRYTLAVGSEKAMKSGWVRWEIDRSHERDPSDQTLLPLKFEEIDLPDDLARLYWVDFQDPANDEAKAREVAGLIRSADARLGRQRRGFRSPATNKEEVGAFPPAPMYEFQGRARELHELERQFRAHRAILLHAMGGMGKSALATEAAHWWTRSGLFRDGACFVSFEQFASAERVEQVLGAYLEGPNFESLPAAEQHRRAIELFNEKDVLVVWDNFESVLPQFNEEAGSLQVNEEMSEQAVAAQVNEAFAAASPVQVGPYTPDERARLFELFHDLTAAPKGRGRLLVTCRPGETGLPGALKTELQGLARPDSLWLLSRVIAKDGLTLKDPRLTKDKLNPLLDTLADHPLSIELVAPHLKKLTPEAIIADFAKLITEFRRGAGVERNESLLASLAFSTRRLSEAAQAALPWLGMFSGGVFEQVLLFISELDPQQWETARAELEATALIRVEDDSPLANSPYLRFHPTVTYAAVGRTPTDLGLVRRRFVEVYLDLLRSTDRQLKGSNPRAALDLLEREEANVRTAVRWAVTNREYSVASIMAHTFSEYLEMLGRLRERDALVTWLAGEVRQGGFSQALADRERDEAWTLFTRGDALEAISRLRNLIERLRIATEFDPAFELALTQEKLGRVLTHSGLSDQAIPVLDEAVKRWKVLITRVGPDRDGKAERGNLSATLGSLANALMAAGRLDAALTSAESALAIQRELGQDRDVAVGLTQCAGIFVQQGRYAEADAQYDDALAAARHCGHKELEATILQNQGSLADDLGQYDRAASLCQRALKLFQEMNDEPSIMRTCNLLGVVERNQGRLREARTWHERSREIARRLGDVRGQANAAQNISIICKQEGEVARQQGRDLEARQRFEEAKRLVTESLRLEQHRSNDPAAAQSLSQLARIYLLLGELDEAERRAHEAHEIREGLGLKEVVVDYDTLAEISLARGNEVQAAEWERKRDAMREELERRAGVPGGLPPPFLQAVQALAMACARAAVEHVPLEPEAYAALDQLAQMPPPMPDLASFLRRVAAGELPSVPPDLPADLAEFLTQLLQAIKGAH